MKLLALYLLAHVALLVGGWRVHRDALERARYAGAVDVCDQIIVGKPHRVAGSACQVKLGVGWLDVPPLVFRGGEE